MILTEFYADDLYEGLKTNNLVQYDKVLTGYVGSESFLRKIAEVVRDIKSRNPNAVYCKWFYVMVMYFDVRHWYNN